MTEPDIRAQWSASMPIRARRAVPGSPFTLDGSPFTIEDNPGCRPWNGRDLTREERAGCAQAFLGALAAGQGWGGAAQIAYEWLSAHAW